MEVKSNIAQIIAKLEAKKNQALSIDYSIALSAGINAAMAQMKFRIFNDGLDKANESLGKYVGSRSRVTRRKFANREETDKSTKNKLAKKRKSLRGSVAREDELTEYEKKRLSEGRQINHKDLEFSGSLRRSIVIAVTSPTQVSCIINNEENLKIAQYQEEQIGRIRGASRISIFSLSEQENETRIKNTREAIKQLYDSLLNN